MDGLPPNYKEGGEFKKMFSVVESPPYCQVKSNLLQNKFVCVCVKL